MQGRKTAEHVWCSRRNRRRLDIDIRRGGAPAEALAYGSNAGADGHRGKRGVNVCSSIALDYSYRVRNLQTCNSRVAESVVANSGDCVSRATEVNGRWDYDVARVNGGLVSSPLAVDAGISNSGVTSPDGVIHPVVIGYDIVARPFGSVIIHSVSSDMNASIVGEHVRNLGVDSTCDVRIHIGHAGAIT